MSDDEPVDSPELAGGDGEFRELDPPMTGFVTVVVG